MLWKMIFSISCMSISFAHGMDFKYMWHCWQPAKLVVYNPESVQEFFLEALRNNNTAEARFFVQKYKGLLEDVDLQNKIANNESTATKKLFAMLQQAYMKKCAHAHE
jgi:hypothetical protein